MTEEPKLKPSAKMAMIVHDCCHGNPERGISRIEFPEHILLKHRQFEVAAKIEVSAAGNRSPAFWRVTDASLIRALNQAAMYGLVPGEHGWLVPFFNAGKAEAVFMRSHRGVMDMVARGGKYRMKVDVVSDVDDFEYEETAGAPLFRHVKNDLEPGGIRGVYLKAHPKDEPNGWPLIVYLPWWEIEKRMEASKKRNKGKQSPAWAEWPREMAMKTVIHYAYARGLLQISPNDIGLMSAARSYEAEYEPGYDQLGEGTQSRYQRPRRMSDQVVDVEAEDVDESPLDAFDLASGDIGIMERARDEFGVNVEELAAEHNGDKEAFLRAVVDAANAAKGAA